MTTRTWGAAFVLVALLATGSVEAYEDDVHYGLTKWLGLQAGFDEPHAETLAHKAVWVDHSIFSAPLLVPYYACLRRNADGSRVVQRIHFPGDGPLPSEPEDRAVAPGSYEAARAIRDELQWPAKVLAVGIGNFGEGLHPYEDSWSHRGTPDIPLPLICSRKLSWAHPRARGGWSSHDADLTYLYRPDALAMAKATFERLCEYAAATLEEKCARLPDALSTDLEAFVSASTKAQKRTWFTAHGFKDTSFLRHTSLPRGKGYSASFADTLIRPSNPQALAENEESHFMLAFFAQWMTTGNEQALVESMVDAKSFRHRFASPELARTVEPAMVAPVLALWRVREHGDAASALHGSAMNEGALFKALDQTKDVNIPYKRVEDALLPLDEAGSPFYVLRLDQDTIVALARLRHAPYESIAVIARRENGRYRIVGIDSVVDR